MFKQKQWQYFVGVCLAVMTVVFAVQFLSRPAAAQTWSSGVPVRCVPDNADELINASGAAYFQCFAADGTVFGDGDQTVPSGYYLMVTDIVITPDRLTTVDTAHEVMLRNLSSNLTIVSEMSLEVFRSETNSLHFTTPYLILEAGNRLSGEHFSMDSFGLKVYVSGLLVTNVTFLPSVTRP